MKTSIDAFVRSNLRPSTAQSLVSDLAAIHSRGNYALKELDPPFSQLHLGCGARRIRGWLNVDLAGSDFDLDLAWNQPFPWKRDVFTKVASQHFIEHICLTTELIPLLRRLNRVCVLGAEVWLSCPDMRKVCESYLRDKGNTLYEGRRRRFPNFSLGSIPVQHLINDLFRQRGEHMNLFDYELLSWALAQGGFEDTVEVNETIFLEKNPEFPPRDDDEVSLYVRSVKTRVIS